jgi:diadenosine tetraphosphate (Ap4A) HIT family hydrolase
MECALCAARLAEAYRVIYQDDHVFVLLNVEPLKDGHVMILPVRHAENLKDLTPEESRAFLVAIDQCMEAMTRVYDHAPMCHVNGWKHRSQPHLHAHVLPSAGSVRELYVAAEGSPRRRRASEDELRAIAERLVTAFGLTDEEGPTSSP